MLFFLYFIAGLLIGILGLYFFARPKPGAMADSSFIKLQAENTFLKKQKEELLQEVDEGRKRERESREEAVRLRTELNGQKRHYEVLTEKQKQLAEKAKIEFENTARKIFAENSKVHREESQRNLSQLLTPLKENIFHFSKSVSGFEEQKKSFQETITGFKTINQEMRDAHRQFTQALKGDTRAQGHWGEFVLESILEKSGLRKGQDWISQGRGLGLKGEGGDLLRPDVIVNLPEGKHIVIDAKVSLTSYQQFCSTEKEEEKKKHLSDLETSLSRHIERLSSKEYHSQLKSPDFTLMFIPSEGVFFLLTESRQGLFDKAWQKSIVIVSPTTLYATLKTIASIWKIEQYNRNAGEIAREGGRLYDKFVGFVESMTQIDKGLKIARNSYEKARGQLTGHGSLIRKAKKLQAKGGEGRLVQSPPSPKAQTGQGLPLDSAKNLAPEESRAQEESIVQGIEKIKHLGAKAGDKHIPSSFSSE